MKGRVRSIFRYSERAMKYIQESTRSKLESIGIKPDQFVQLKQWHSGNYYGSLGRDQRCLLAEAKKGGLFFN